MTGITKTTAIAEYLSNLPSYIYRISALRKGSKVVTETIRAQDKYQALRFFEDEHGPFSQYAIVCEDEPIPEPLQPAA